MSGVLEQQRTGHGATISKGGFELVDGQCLAPQHTVLVDETQANELECVFFGRLQDLLDGLLALAAPLASTLGEPVAA